MCVNLYACMCEFVRAYVRLFVYICVSVSVCMCVVCVFKCACT